MTKFLMLKCIFKECGFRWMENFPFTVSSTSLPICKKCCIGPCAIIFDVYEEKEPIVDVKE